MQAEKGAVSEDGPAEKGPVSFFDPALGELRKRVYLEWARTVLILCLFVLCVLSLFWGSQFTTEEKLETLNVWVVDFDGKVDPYKTSDPFVGPIITDVAQKYTDSNGLHLGYHIKAASEFDYDPIAVRQAVYDEHAYAAIIVNPNATVLLRDAISTRNTTYDPTGAAQTIVISARDQNTYYSLHPARPEYPPDPNPSYLRPTLSPPMTCVPFYPAVAAPAVTIGLIYLIIIAFFTFPFLMPIHSQFMKADGHPPLNVPHWLIWRIVSNITAYFFLSFFYSLVSLAFEIPFSNPPAPDVIPAENANAYHRGSFVVFWMLNWVGMTALGFPCENMAMILGMPWSSLFLIFWVISNVATGFYPLDLAPGFYRWGYAWPLHRIVEALRTILFGTHSRIGLDFGVLFAWIAVSLAFYPVATFIMRWKMKRGL
ncbi:hypothetical protein N7468_008853 [Penicillium chermesinum]|uniref:DUF3533 domain-containing protein n=1 Tax=Penicillium chermesinum TaxID=63820 RepID=A0A9W9TEN9_9EURO|nr:uncharacterized protein N7468_008853 [Penicillium chermesinum]KAJ5219649.1 hypothetical protein N7468_008853 [Penicillium chermesinum]